MATPSGPSRLGPWELANRKPIRLNPDGDRAFEDDLPSSQQSTQTRRRRRSTRSTSSPSSSAPSYTRHAACLVASLLVQSMMVTAAPATPSASNEYTRDSRFFSRGQTGQESIHMAGRSNSWSRLSEEQKRQAATAGIKDQILATNGESYPRSSRSIQSNAFPLTHQTRSIPLVRKRATNTDSAKAYSSGIIADWTHQSRSVWFERKAIIITSCFLAIFIVLIIGVTVLVSGRKGGLDDIDEEEFSDDAAIRRMLRERKMRGGGQKETRKQKRQRKKEMKEKEGASLGTSTAISKRIVSKWVRSPGRSVSTSSPRGTVDQADSSGVRTSGDVTSLQSTRSDGRPRTRLGEPRQESVSIEYRDGDGNPLPPASRQTSPEASASGSRSTATSHDSPPPGSRTLDETDIQAAEGAEQSEIAMPPAYITANGGSNAPPASSSVPPVMQRPLAGEVPAIDGDSKQPPTTHATSTAAVIPLGPPTPFEEQGGSSQPSVNNADDPTTGHIAVDDKARLAAMAAAASAPSMAPPRLLNTLAMEVMEKPRLRRRLLMVRLVGKLPLRRQSTSTQMASNDPLMEKAIRRMAHRCRQKQELLSTLELLRSDRGRRAKLETRLQQRRRRRLCLLYRSLLELMSRSFRLSTVHTAWPILLPWVP